MLPQVIWKVNRIFTEVGKKFQQKKRIKMQKIF